MATVSVKRSPSPRLSPPLSAPATQVGLRYSACRKVDVVFFSDFFQASEYKREAREDSSPSRVFALHTHLALTRKTRKNGVFSAG